MKRIYLINTPEYPSLGTNYLFNLKFINTFSYHGLECNEITDFSTFNQLEDSEDQIFFLCDNFYDHRRPSWKEDFKFLAEKFSKSVWIFWSFHNVLSILYEDDLFPFKKSIFTGEYYRNPNIDVLGKNFEYYINLKNYVPLPFSAGKHPDTLEELWSKRTDTHDCGFCGCQYKVDWSRKLSEKYNCFIHYYPPFLDEETRLQKVFLDSKICLGFNSDHAVENGMPTERVFEGVAYGCVVLTDCPMAVEATDGAAVLVTNYAELEEKVEYYLNNDNARLEKQKQGMEFAKSKGTYYSVVGDFLKTIHEIYQEKK